MTVLRPGILLVAVLFLLFPTGRSPQSQTATNQNVRAGDTLKVGVSEVLLDIVATDKRGRQIRDLKPEEFEVYEDGVKQQIVSLRQVEAEDSVTGEPVPAGTPPAPLDPLRQIRLVTLVFDQLGPEARQLAQRAALDFLETELKQNVFVAVFKIDLRLTILQQFTNNRELLRKAVDLATTGTFNQFETQSDAIQKTLERLSSAQAAADAAAAPGSAGNTSTIGSSAADAKMAEMQLTMLRYSETMTREQQGRSTIFSLMSLAKEQRLLPGRKTMIYFSEGIQVPSNVKPHWDTLMSLSNRSNVSIYAVDARGLLSLREGLAGGIDLAGAAAQSQRQMATRGSGPVSRADVMIGEQAEEAIRKNVQNTLAELAENTGGFLIANTNDLRTGMRRVASEVSSYYALSYLPSNPSLDGKFRKLTVKVRRPGIKLQTRHGYFALPLTEGTPVFPYEMPMLSALDANKALRDITYRNTSLVYPTKGQRSEVVVYTEIPLADFAFRVDGKTKEYEANISTLAIVRDQSGQVVQKISQLFPLRGPKAQAADTQSRNIVFYRTLELLPGRYNVESVVRDGISEKMSIKRSILMVPPHEEKSAALSTVALVKRLDDARGSTELARSPLNFQERMVIPNLQQEINSKETTDLLFYFVAVIPSGESKLTMDMIVSRDGKALGRLGETSLPAPDESGRVPYVAKLPLSSFSPGNYDVQVLISHSGTTTSNSVSFVIR
jgi:VWFA-related protein